MPDLLSGPAEDENIDSNPYAKEVKIWLFENRNPKKEK